MSRYFPPLDAAPRHLLFPGVVTRTCWTDRLMLSYVELEANAVVPEHSHPHDQAGMVIEGRAVFIIAGEAKTLGPGDWYLAPGGTPHRVEVLDAPCRVLDVFTPPRETYQ